jgi:PKD repeat protein
MKFIYTLFFTSLFTLTSLNNFSQEIQSCGTQTSAEDLQFINDNMNLLRFYENEYYNLKQTKSSTALTSIPVKVHIINDDSGDGGININDVIQELNEVNDYFQNSFVEFYICDEVNYINDSSLFNYNYDTQQDLLFSNHQSDILNIYFVNDLLIEDNSICGYTYLPGNSSQYYDAVVMLNQCTTGTSSDTLAHELGHHLNLIHTHGPTNGALTNELVVGTNCSTAGDLLCDTPADPQLGSSNVTQTCQYVGDDIDNNGFPFDPDTSNIMSYSRDSCTDNFTEQQYARMYAGYHAFKNYYACPSLNISFNTEESAIDCGEQLIVNYNDESVNATSWEWDVNGDDVVDYTQSSFSHTYESPGDYDVSLKISDGSESITKVFPNYISFSANVYETSKIYLNVSVKNGINENTWELKDGSGSILYSGGPYDSNGLYEHEFDIALDCYEFIMYDSAGDGLTNDSWNLGSEYYELLDENNVTIKYGRDFEFQESTSIKNEYLSLSKPLDINFMIYPNPANDYINLKSELIIDRYTIYDIKGSLILEKTNNNSNDLIISLKNIYSGIYFLEIKSGIHKKTIKFIKK